MADADEAAAPSLERDRAGDVGETRSCWPDAAAADPIASVEGGCCTSSTEEAPEIARRRSLLRAERCDGDAKDNDEEELANAAAPTMVPVSCRRDGTDLLRPIVYSLALTPSLSFFFFYELERDARSPQRSPCQKSGFILEVRLFLKKSFMFHDVSASCASQNESRSDGQTSPKLLIRSRNQHKMPAGSK